MANIGLPKFSLIFKGLGKSAVERGSKGVAVLIIKDSTDKTFTFAEYTSTDDLTSTEIAKYAGENLQYINDVLEGNPLKLIVARMDKDGVLVDLLALIKGKTARNCWIAMADSTQAETDALVNFVKSENKNNKKRYKAFVYKATSSDDQHIINFTTNKITFADTSRGTQIGIKAVPYFLGYLAGLPLSMSSIAKALTKFTSVEEPVNLETAINNGEFVLMNDEGKVRVARGVTSLVTTGEGITDDFKYILITEVMDLIFCDIYTTWGNYYKGKWKNNGDNQALLIGAINDYFDTLELENLLDENFENIASVDIKAQRIANYTKYGQDVVSKWTDNYAKEMTVGTNVYLKANVRILNAMEDISFIITM